MGIKKISIVLMALFMVFGIVGCSSNSASEGSGNVDKSSDSGSTTSKSGGTLKIAYNAQPETLDPVVTTANATRDPARLIFESLVTLNKNYQVTPQLAKSYKISNDGKTVTFKLRKGVKFHNGEEMKSDDVVASMDRWEKHSSTAKAALDNPKWTAKGDYTVQLHVSKPSSIMMHALADQGQLAAIMPKEIVQAAGPTGVKKYIGTGPFKFDEWKKDQYIHFTKFKDYQLVSKPASGLAGKKEALVNDIYWYSVPDESTRVNGLISGQYDFAHMLSYDSVGQLKNTPGKVVDIWPYGTEILVFNKKHGLFKDVKVRRAVNLALDKKVVMQAAYTDKKYYTLDPGLFLKKQTDWYTDAGKNLYNQKNTKKAKKLLKESGYNGEKVVILTSRDYPTHYRAAVATQQQLEKIGINAKLEVYDWATLLQRREKPKLWDIFFTGYPVMSVPQQYSFLDSKSNWPGWTNNPKIDKLLAKIKTSKSQQEAKALFVKVQKTMWEDVPVINVGKDSRVSGYSDTIHGYKDFLGPVFWNVSKTKK